jgi:hypothetical protein
MMGGFDARKIVEQFGNNKETVCSRISLDIINIEMYLNGA